MKCHPNQSLSARRTLAEFLVLEKEGLPLDRGPWLVGVQGREQLLKALDRFASGGTHQKVGTQGNRDVLLQAR